MEFFREGIMRAQRRANLPLREDTQFYVVNLLSEFLAAGKLEETPLALIYARAVQTENPNEQYQLLKQIGDRSLYVSGFFPDSLKRRVVNIDYYIGMGERAYASVSSISRGVLFADTFEELAEKFHRLVDLISDVSESAGVTSDRDLLRLYERWLMTKSERLSEKLRQEGIEPIACKSDNLH